MSALGRSSADQLPSRDWLHGRLSVHSSHSKNVFNHVACAWYLLGPGSLTMHGLPRNEDQRRALGLARQAGLAVEERALSLTVSGQPSPVDLGAEASRSRISICQAIALAARTGLATLRVGGGCGFVSRPIDLHAGIVRGTGGQMRELGEGRLEISYPHGPRAGRLYVRSHSGVSSVGASASALLVTAITGSESVIHGLNQGPEVRLLTDVLRNLGAQITLDGATAWVRGSAGGLSGSASCQIPLDEIALGTYALMGLARWRSVVLAGAASPPWWPGFRQALRDAGVTTTPTAEGLRLDLVPETPRATDITTSPYPGFPTDLAPSWSAWMSQAAGRSTVTEAVYERRDSHLAGLRHAGVRVRQSTPRAYRIEGTAAEVRRPRLEVADIRCGDAFMVLAAASHTGAVLIDPDAHLARGHASPARLLAQFGSSLGKRHDG